MVHTFSFCGKPKPCGMTPMIVPGLPLTRTWRPRMPGIAAVARLPHAVGDEDDGLGAERVLPGQEAAAEDRLDPELLQGVRRSCGAVVALRPLFPTFLSAAAKLSVPAV